MQQRDTFLDFCKGAAIFLVVLGHVLLKSMDLRNGLFNFICLYHMPFFFMLSGYLAWRVKRFDVSFFKKKARTLLLPCFMVGLMFTLINREYDAFIFSEFHNGYWFLWSLFCIWCLFALVKWFISLCCIKNVLIEIGILLLPFFMIKLGGQYLLPSNINSCLSIGFTGAFYRFFIMGYFIGKYDNIKKWFQNKRVNIAGMIGFVLLFLISYLVDLEHIGPFTIVQILLCLSFLCFLRVLYNRLFDRICKRIEKYGCRSLDIYVFHYFVLLLLNLTIVKQFAAPMQYIIALLTAWAIIEVTLLLSNPIERNKYLRLIFLGKIQK